MITKLADKWRAENRQSGWSYESDKADELEAALPTWVRIEWIGDYVDPETLPPEDECVMWGNVDDGYNNLSELWQLPPKRIIDYTHWRRLCDLDSPEQES